MRLRTPSLLIGLGLVAALLLATLAAFPPAVAAQGTPTPTAATQTSTTTPGPTRTPAPTPTATATLTALGVKLSLAQIYLKGGNFAKAAELFAAIATEDPGNPEALKGLADALQESATATVTAAQKPTTAPAPAATSTPGFAGTFASQWNTFTGTALAGLVMILIVYVLAKGLAVPGIIWLRELYQARFVAWLKKQPQLPPIFIGDFTDATAIKDFQGAAIVAQALTESLLRSGRRVPKWSAAVEPAPALDLGAMAWIKVLWNWIVPPPRGYRVSGMLLSDDGKGYRLAVQRTHLSSNSVDASYTFSGAGPGAREAFQKMAQLAAVWLRDPAEVEAELAAEDARRKAAAAAAPPAPGGPPGPYTGKEASQPPPVPLKTTREVFDDALTALGEAQRLAAQGAGSHVDAEAKLRDAESALGKLQSSPRLQDDLRDAIDQIREQMRKQGRA